MTDKNHEQYLEEIETAVAETTKALMESEDYNLREAYRKIAEQDVEIKRLKEYQSNDRKTIRNLRAQLSEAVDEIECRNSTWETKEKEYEGEIVELKEEIEELQEKIENLEEINKMTKDSIKECKEDCDGGVYGLVSLELYTKATEELDLYKEELDIAHFEYEKLKKEIEQWKYWASEVIHWSHSASKDNLQAKKLITSTDQPTIGDVRDFGKEIKELREEIDELKEEHQGICSKYHADFCELEEKRQEIAELKEEQEVMMLQGIYKVKEHEKEIEELKTWNKTQVDEIVGNAIDRIEQDCDAYNQENKRLEKELDKYKTLIHCVWSDLYWADKYGSEVSFKDISNSCEYYENEEFIKKEVVDDDED